MTERDKDTWNRDDDQKAGDPPRPATETGPSTASKSDKTATDPATGVPTSKAPRPNQADG